MMGLITDFVVVRRCMPWEGQVVYSIENIDSYRSLHVLKEDIYRGHSPSITEIKFTINRNSLFYRSDHGLMPGFNFGTGPNGFSSEVFYHNGEDIRMVLRVGEHTYNNLYFDMFLSVDTILSTIEDFEVRNFI